MRIDPRRRGRVASFELRVRRRDTTRFGRRRLEFGATVEILARESAGRRSPLARRAQCRPTRSARCRRASMSATAAARCGLELHDRPVLVGFGEVEEVVTDGVTLGRRWASPSRCRGRDTPASSPSTPTRRRRGRRPPRRRAPTCPTRWVRRAPGGSIAHAAATGIRTRRRRGASPTVTSSPASQCGAARGDPHLAERALRASRARRPRSGRASPDASARIDVRHPSSTALRRALLRRGRLVPRVAASAVRSTTSVSRSMRSRTTSGATKSSTISAAAVPGRGENTNVYAAS